MILHNSESKGGIEIKDNVWIGENITILAGVKICKGVIITGSVVTKDVYFYQIVAGVPARKIGNRY